MSKTLLAVASLFLIFLGTSGVSGQEYPNKPIRILTGSPGGGSDFNARQVAQGISGPLGQSVIVENRSSILVGEIAAKAPPDGYNLAVHGAALWLGPLLQRYAYDIERDFAPISLLSREIMMLTVHPSLPVKSVKELIALTKARPGELNYASSTPGSPAFLGGQLLKSMTPINVLLVPYKGTTQAFTAVLSGESQLTIGDLGLIVPQTKSGKLRALAVTSATPSVLAPGVPTMVESGLPGFELAGETAIWAPAKTPGAIINRLNQEMVRYLNRPDTKERFLGNVMEVVASSPEQLGARMKSDLVKWGKLFRDAGIKVE